MFTKLLVYFKSDVMVSVHYTNMYMLLEYKILKILLHVLILTHKDNTTIAIR